MASSYTANNKILYDWKRGARPVPPSLLTSYAESIIFDGDKRVLWHKGRQFGNSYYGSEWGENYNDFLNNTAIGAYSHAEGSHTDAEGAYSNASGFGTKAEGDASHAEGGFAYAPGDYAHAEGELTNAEGRGSHAEGYDTDVLEDYAHAEGIGTSADANGSHAEGQETITYGEASHAEGKLSITYGAYSHAEGEASVAYGDYSHAEGKLSVAYGDGSHAEGDTSTAYGDYSHSEGQLSISYGDYSHAEGRSSISYGAYSHAEGEASVAYGDYSHAEGKLSYAIGDHSLTLGTGTQAYNDSEVAIGQWNESGEGVIFSIGDGNSYEDRHNIMTVTKEATYITNLTYFTAYAYGDISNTYVQYTGENVPMDLLVQAFLDEAEYTHPVIYTRFAYQPEGYDGIIYPDESYYSSQIDPAYTLVTYMETGTIMNVGLQVLWPTCYLGGTRMDTLSPDYDTIEPEKLGYSYGITTGTFIGFTYNGSDDIDYPHREAETTGQMPPSSICQDYICHSYACLLDIGSDVNVLYDAVKDITLSYEQSSYMVYKQLKKVDKTKISYGGNSKWFEGDTIILPVNWKIFSRYRWYSGFSDAVPVTRQDVMTFGNEVQTGFLDFCDNEILSYITHKVSKEDSLETGYFWFAVPENYELEPWDEYTSIECRRNDGIAWDLVSPQQDFGAKYVNNFEIGENVRLRGDREPGENDHTITKPYAIYYVKLNFGALGNDGEAVINIKLRGNPGIIHRNYLLIDSGERIAYEDGTGSSEFCILYDEAVDFFGLDNVIRNTRFTVNDERGFKYIYNDLVNTPEWQQHISNAE